MSGVRKVNPNGTVITYKEGPSGLTQGTELTTRPPNEMPSAEAEKGSINALVRMKVARIFESGGMFPLYTGPMSPRRYLPSAQFLVIVGSLLIAGGTVAGAQYYISSKNAPSALTSAGLEASRQEWEESLAEIQAESGIGLPQAPDPEAINSLITQAQSSNLTDSIGRSILARLTAANAQGLGDDIPTQDSIIAEASARVSASVAAVQPPAITQVEPTEESQRTFGNGVMAAMGRHPAANSNDTMGIIAKATDTRITAPLSGLTAIGQEYGALARDLSLVPVPTTLAPLYQQVVRNIAAIATLYEDMKEVVDDPIKGLAAVQQYQELMAQTGEVLTNIAQTLKNGGILFSKDEPGSAWEIFLSVT